MRVIEYEKIILNHIRATIQIHLKRLIDPAFVSVNELSDHRPVPISDFALYSPYSYIFCTKPYFIYIYLS